MILAAAQGRENKDIAMELGCTRRTVGTWRNRFAEKRMVGIEADAPRGGRTATQRAKYEAEIIRMTTPGIEIYSSVRFFNHSPGRSN